MDDKVKKAEDFRSISIDGVFGGVSSQGAKILVIHSSYKPKARREGGLELEDIEHTIEVELDFDPVQLKKTIIFLQKKLKEFEEKYGEIKIQKEKEKEEKQAIGYI